MSRITFSLDDATVAQKNCLYTESLLFTIHRVYDVPHAFSQLRFNVGSRSVKELVLLDALTVVVRANARPRQRPIKNGG